MTKQREKIKAKRIQFLLEEAKQEVIKIVGHSQNLKDFLWSLTEELIRDIFVQIKKIDKYIEIKFSYWLKDLKRKDKHFNFVDLLDDFKK
ncbi:Uncharacterised protein (plasmid) [Mesomycoplasma conjunctivae]|uniref:Uncharacterized protein n=1 Tax=Mesomycoplasma conjunctivae (strain ATCC 25834 / NCTC 10147 / HRC/581) TaxID=572263 RepID=C5J6F4_MESCH|nr:hypothetical protein [Mesomycoplasma conjunctivae]CAT05046.1 HYPOTHETICAL PROTEIN MCJ_003570 [Mesomycoplasma conjunctivae]VEU66296.1 Uncharacterised protein [Mesomycoplasma conjunctivae]VEU66808.1 Uncharacterised protein [Mesomycoplasma conjunctivae]